jgi:hypothetical protein
LQDIDGDSQLSPFSLKRQTQEEIFTQAKSSTKRALNYSNYTRQNKDIINHSQVSVAFDPYEEKIQKFIPIVNPFPKPKKPLSSKDKYRTFIIKNIKNLKNRSSNDK